MNQSRISAMPILTWPGKHQAPPLPSSSIQLAELFDASGKWRGIGGEEESPPAPRPSPPAHPPLAPPNSLFLGDNRAILTHLLANGYASKVKLIYIDPPYDSGVNWGRKVRLRGEKALTMQTSAEHIFGKQAQYRDRWHENEYLQFMYDRLPLLRDLLCEEGSLWLHVDHRQVHHLRVLMQEIFGEENYLNTITWRSQTARGAKVNAFYFPYSSHFIEIFAKNRDATTWNPSKKQIILNEAEAEREFMRDEGGFFRTSDPGTYSFESLRKLHQASRLYAPFGGEIIVDEAAQRIYGSKGGNIGVKYYLTALKNGRWAVERAIDNIWEDIPGLGTTPGEDLGYPTQKTEALLERIIRTSTNPGDLVLDCFMGSGTTLAVAQKLGRQWIGCDNNRGALGTTRRRLMALMAGESKGEDGFAVYHVAEDENVGAVSIPHVLLSTEVHDGAEEVRYGNRTYEQPSPARIQITENPTDPATIQIQIVDFAIPSLVAESLDAEQMRHVQAQSWRAVVDCVEIDPAYDGSLFRCVVVDAPMRKNEQVKGMYTLPKLSASKLSNRQPIAVRITDVVGEETLIVCQHPS